MVHGKASIKAHPIVVGGGIFPIENLTTLNMLDRSKIRASVRGWEKAGSTKDDSAYTAGVLMHAMNDKTYVVPVVGAGPRAEDQVLRAGRRQDVQQLSDRY
jgi:phage terminase large subunit-like protein